MPGMNSRVAKKVRLLTIAVFAALIAVGCRSGSSGHRVPSEAIDGIPVGAEATRAAGHPLGNGFTVAPGTALLGEAFPYVNPFTDRMAGWDAYLVVTGDPLRVMASYRDQAEAAGIPLAPSNVVPSEDPIRGTPTYCTDSPELGYLCSATGKVSTERASRLIAVEIHRGHNPPASWALVSYREVTPTSETQTPAPPYALGTSAPELPNKWPRLSGPGARIRPFVGDSSTELRIEPGSRAIAHVMVSQGGTPQVLLAIDGDPDEVAKRYKEQFDRELIGDARVFPRKRAGRYEVWSVAGGDPGGASLQIQLFRERQSKATWGVLSSSYD